MDKNGISIITSADFQNQGTRSLNFGDFTNIEKAISEVAFVSDYVQKGEHEIYKAEDIAKFIVSVKGELDKGELDKIEKAEGSKVSKEDIIEKAKSQINSLERVEVLDTKGEKIVYFVKAKSEEEVVKDDEGNVLEKAEEDDENTIMKGGIAYKLTGMGEKMFKKTGKEIKVKLSTLKDKIEDKEGNLKTLLVGYEEAVGYTPTENLSDYMTEGLEDKLVGLKEYKWEMTYYNKNNKADMAGTATTYSDDSDKSVMYPKDEKTAKAARDYNNTVRKLVGCIKDRNKVGVFERNVDEKKSYEMTLNQLEALGF